MNYWIMLKLKNKQEINITRNLSLKERFSNYKNFGWSLLCTAKYE